MDLCSFVPRCKENLISTHVGKFPVSKRELFQYLLQFRECDVFLSSICDEFYRSGQRNQWHSKINITGALEIGRSILDLMKSEAMARYFVDLGYKCKIPVNIALKFDNDLFSEGLHQRALGKLNFHGGYHENYGIMFRAEAPIRVAIDLFCASEIEEKIITKIKYGLMVKNAYDAMTQMEERRNALDDVRTSNEKGELARAHMDHLASLDRVGLRDLNYSLTTILKLKISSTSDAAEIDKNVTDGFLNIDDWSLISKI